MTVDIQKPLTTEGQIEVADNIISELLKLAWEDRREVLWLLQYNDFFCFRCGLGSRENPNTACQCWNDE